MGLYRRGPEPANPKRDTRVWWYSFTFAGRRIQESAKTTSKTIAQNAMDNRRKELEKALAGMPVESRTERIKSVGQVVAEYLKHYPSNHRPKSVIAANQRLGHVQRLLSAVLLIDLTEKRIREYIAARLEEGAGGRTINMELGELSRAMGGKWSVLWPRVRKLEENHDVGRALSPDEERRLLQAAAADDSPNRNPGLYAFIQIALATGMRAGEIAGLTWGQVDFEAGVITVGKAKTAAGSYRQIPMHPHVRAALESHAAWYANPKRMGELRPEWYIFPARAGRPKAGEKRPYDPTKPVGSVTKSWQVLRERAGVQCRLHDLRHTAITKLAEAGVSEHTLKALAGHMSRAMLEKYSHIRMQAKRAAIEALALPDLTAEDTTPKPSATKSTTLSGSRRPN